MAFNSFEQRFLGFLRAETVSNSCAYPAHGRYVIHVHGSVHRDTDGWVVCERTRDGVGKGSGNDHKTTLLYSAWKRLSVQEVLSAWHTAKHLGGQESSVNQDPHPRDSVEERDRTRKT